MKISKEAITSQAQQTKKSRGLKATPSKLLGDVKLKKGNLKQDMVSFGSPVVKKEFIGSCSERFITGISKFIDDFEGATKEMRNKLGRRLIKDTSAEKDWANRKGVSYPQTEYSKSEQVDSREKDKFLGLGLFTETEYDYDDYKAKYLGGGVSGDVYSLYMSYFDSPSYVIKEAKKKKHSDPINGAGGIIPEFENLKKYGGKNFQTGIALMETRDGNYFLISKFEKGDAAGIKRLSHTEREFNPIMTTPIETKEIGVHNYYVSGLFLTLKFMQYLDQQNLFNSDLNIGNILYIEDKQTFIDPKERNIARVYCEKPILIDLQWLMPMDKAYKFFTFAPNEKETNFAPFEAGFVASYMHGLNEYITLEGSSNQGRNEAREFLISYLQERAKYCDSSNRFERIRKVEYQNPSEDVLDAEILRLSILKNHNHQFLYNDGLNETPRDMLKGLRYMARANLAAKMLSEFNLQKDQSQMSENEKAYFKEMRQLGSFWHGKTQEWYRAGLASMQSKILKYPQSQYPNGDEQVYWPKAYGQGVNPEDKGVDLIVPDKTMLSDVLSDETKDKWDDIMEKDEEITVNGRTATFNSLSSYITKLEKSFIKLKQAVDNKDYSSQNNIKQEISKTISEVLI